MNNNGVCISIWTNPANRNAAECVGWHRPPSPLVATAARLSGRWKYAWLHLVLWGSCGEKGQVELMDYSRTLWGCRLSNAAGCLSRKHHFYFYVSPRPKQAHGRPQAITCMHWLYTLYCKEKSFRGNFRLIQNQLQWHKSRGLLFCALQK